MSKLFRGRSPRLQGRLESPCGLMPQGNAQATADTFLAEAGVVDWIRTLNERKGVAPPVSPTSRTSTSSFAKNVGLRPGRLLQGRSGSGWAGSGCGRL